MRFGSRSNPLRTRCGSCATFFEKYRFILPTACARAPQTSSLSTYAPTIERVIRSDTIVLSVRSQRYCTWECCFVTCKLKALYRYHQTLTVPGGERDIVAPSIYAEFAKEEHFENLPRVEWFASQIEVEINKAREQAEETKQLRVERFSFRPLVSQR